MLKLRIPPLAAPLALTLAAPACDPTPAEAAEAYCKREHACFDLGSPDGCTEQYTYILEMLVEQQPACGEAFVDRYACVGDTPCEEDAVVACEEFDQPVIDAC